MATSDVCYKCKAKVDWEIVVWDISTIKGYKSKVYICECGHRMSKHVPMTDEKISFWRSLFS